MIDLISFTMSLIIFIFYLRILVWIDLGRGHLGKFIPAFWRTVIRWSDGNIELLHFFKPMKSQYSISINYKTADRLKLAEISVEGQSFNCTSVRRCAGELEQT